SLHDALPILSSSVIGNRSWAAVCSETHCSTHESLSGLREVSFSAIRSPSLTRSSRVVRISPVWACVILPYITTSAFNSCPIFCGVAACEPNNEGATLDEATFKPCRCLSALTSSSVTVGPRHWFAATPSHVIGVTASVCPALVHVV